jgi:hypothetical protein
MDLHHPNDDFRMSNLSRVRFRSSFQWCGDLIWETIAGKCFEMCSEFLFDLPNVERFRFISPIAIMGVFIFVTNANAFALTLVVPIP